MEAVGMEEVAMVAEKAAARAAVAVVAREGAGTVVARAVVARVVAATALASRVKVAGRVEGQG
jgi:hypothetical protein